MDGIDRPLVGPISKSNGWISMKLCTNINAQQMMCSNNFGNPLTFPLKPL